MVGPAPTPPRASAPSESGRLRLSANDGTGDTGPTRDDTTAPAESVRLTDVPAHGKGRRYIIERGLSRMDELRAIVPPEGDLRPCHRPPSKETR